jgi:hypothetical protein
MKSYRELEQEFEEFINDTHEIVTICGYNYDPAQALKSIDPIAFDQEFLAYLDQFHPNYEEEETA